MRILRLAVLLAATGAALAGCASVLPKLEAPQLAVTSVVIGALGVLWAGAAIAVVPVTDVVTEANTLQSTINEVTAAAKRIELELG